MVLFGHQGECVLRPLCTRNLEVRSLTSGGGDKTVLVKQDGENRGVGKRKTVGFSDVFLLKIFST